MTSTPLFSILIANYNNGQYLEECLRSVFDQTYTNWEIILVDDGSKDLKSTAIYEKYKDHPKIKIFLNKENKGCGYSKHRCAEKAEGEICGFLDPDDTIAPETISIVFNKLFQDQGIAIAYTNHFVCNENLEIQHVSPHNGKIPENESNLSYEGPKIGPFAAFRTSNYRKTEGINPYLKRAVDQDLYYKLEETGKLLYIDKSCYYYRYHSGGISTTNNFYKAIYWNLKVAEEARKRRIKNKTSITNITRRNLSLRWLDYYHSRMIEKSKSKETCKVFYLFIKALRHLFYDKNINTIKILAYSLLGKYKKSIDCNK